MSAEKLKSAWIQSIHLLAIGNNFEFCNCIIILYYRLYMFASLVSSLSAPQIFIAYSMNNRAGKVWTETSR